jgi:hypothetical protein
VVIWEAVEVDTRETFAQEKLESPKCELEVELQLCPHLSLWGPISFLVPLEWSVIDWPMVVGLGEVQNV